MNLLRRIPRTASLVLALLVLHYPSADLRAQLTTHPWPTGPGQATVSDRYEVYVALGAGPEQKLEVLMSNVISEGDFAANELAGRTFSFVNLDYTATGGALRPHHGARLLFAERPPQLLIRPPCAPAAFSFP